MQIDSPAEDALWFSLSSSSFLQAAFFFSFSSSSSTAFPSAASAGTKEELPHFRRGRTSKLETVWGPSLHRSSVYPTIPPAVLVHLSMSASFLVFCLSLLLLGLLRFLRSSTFFSISSCDTTSPDPPELPRPRNTNECTT